MKEKLAGAAGKAKEFFGKLSAKTRVLLGVGLAAVILIAVVAAIYMNNLPYTTLFTGITSAEVASISAYLEENGVTDYKVQNADTILVRHDQEAQLKAKLLMAGYPKSGFAYETYKGMASVLSTDADRRTAYLYDLQDRMSAVIRCLEGVKDAHVTIAQGEDRRYVLDSTNVLSASAAVMVQMETGAVLTDQQASAIRNLVAKSVQGLQIDDISIADSNGNTYSGGGATSLSDASSLKLYLEEKWNNRTRDSIIQVLGPLFGEDNVRVAVNTSVDVSRRVGESTRYSSPEGAPEGEGIIGRRVYDQEVVRDGEAAAGGVAGNATNADIPTYVEDNVQVNGDENYVRSSGEDQYNVDKDQEQVEHLAGTVADMMISITINSSTAGSVDANSLVGHVARASGITQDMQNDKISILVQPFLNKAEPEPQEPSGLFGLPNWVVYAAAGGITLFLLILILILVGKSGKKKKKGTATAAAKQAAGAVEEEPQGADIMNIRSEKSMELRKDIRQFADENPEIAAQLVKSWLRGGEEGHG